MRKVSPNLLLFLKNRSFVLSLLGFIIFIAIGILFECYNSFMLAMFMFFGTLSIYHYFNLVKIYETYIIKFKWSEKQYYLFYSQEDIIDINTLNSSTGLLHDISFSGEDKDVLILSELVLKVQNYHLPDKDSIFYLTDLKESANGKNVKEIKSNASALYEYLSDYSYNSLQREIQNMTHNIDKSFEKFDL